MRVNTDGRYQYREDLYSQVAEMLGENTKSGGIDASAEFTRQMLANLERAADHPDMTPELADVLSTSKVNVQYEIRSGVDVDGRD